MVKSSGLVSYGSGVFNMVLSASGLIDSREAIFCVIFCGSDYDPIPLS